MAETPNNLQPGEVADWSALVRRSPNLLSESLALEPAGTFTRDPCPSGPDYVFYRRREEAAAEGFGLVSLCRRGAGGTGTYDVAAGAADARAAVKGEYLTSDDFLLAGTERSAVLLVGVSGQVTRACREAMPPEGLAALRPWTVQETEAFWRGQRSPVLHLVAAWRSRPGAGEGDRAAAAFAVECEFLRVLLAAYGRELREAAGSRESAKRLAVRLHEVAWRCGDALGSLTVAGAMAPDRGRWQEPLRAYARIVEALAELPPRLLERGTGAAEGVAAALDELLAGAAAIDGRA